MDTMDESRYGAGYRDSLNHTIVHIIHRIEEENSHKDLWLNEDEFSGYIRALQDMKNYLQWLLYLENKS